jgi:drug/metabolite transporter (DMT)-like permease
VIGHPTLRRLGPLPATTGAMGFGLLLLLPLWAWQGSANDLARLTSNGWLAIVFLGVCCSGLGYLLWYRALERLPASQVSSFLYLEPLVTLAAAVALLGEPVGIATMLGGALLVGGVAILQRSS